MYVKVNIIEPICLSVFVCIKAGCSESCQAQRQEVPSLDDKKYFGVMDCHCGYCGHHLRSMGNWEAASVEDSRGNVLDSATIYIGGIPGAQLS